MSQIVPVILCGGAGLRLWPLSSNDRPKQFLPLVEGQSTFTLALKRVADPDVFAAPLIVTAAEQRHAVVEAMRRATVKGDMLLEPSRRDSAAAIAVASAFVARRNPSAVMLVLAADHVIRDVAGFRRSVLAAKAAAERGKIVTFGVRPTSPATGFGYVARGMELPFCPGVDTVAEFAEKPDPTTAARYVAEERLWNSGSFMMRADTALNEFRRHAADIGEAAERAVKGIVRSEPFLLLPDEPFGAIRATSFDYAVMEKTDRAAVIEASFDWRDLGSYEALDAVLRQDRQGNRATGDVAIRDSRNSSIHAAHGTVAVLGVDDLIVAAGEDAVLVTRKERADDLKDFVAAVARRRGGDGLGRTIRPWGYYDVLAEGPDYRAKRIVVDPGTRLSLQRHRYRSEHWVVVEGVADVTVGESARRLGANDSAFVPQMALHRLGNPGETPLVIIEVQFGAYVGEEDIERFDDDFRRAPVSATGGA